MQYVDFIKGEASEIMEGLLKEFERVYGIREECEKKAT